MYGHLILKLLRRRQLERDLEAELRFHEDSRGHGEAPSGSEKRARVKQHARDLWRWRILEDVSREALRRD